MRCSELIAELATTIMEVGDVEVVVIDNFDNTTVADIEQVGVKILFDRGDIVAILHI